MKGKNERAVLVVIFLAFVLVRVFVSSPYYFISMDEAKYLELSGTFPAHRLFNNQLYLVHPPLFPYLIRLFSLFLMDHIAGISVSFLFALVTFVVTVKLLRFLGKDTYWIAIALFVLVISPLHISTSRVVYKDSMFLGLFLLCLYFFIKGLIIAKRGYLLAAGLFGAACCLTSDLGVYLFPCFILGYWIFRNPKARSRNTLLPLVITGVSYGSWLLVRVAVFMSNAYCPVGVDGTIEYVYGFNLKQLLASRYFPVTATMFDFSLDLTHLRLHGNVYPLCPLWEINHFWYDAFCVFVALTAIVTIVKTIARGKVRNKAAFFFSLLLVLFTLPVMLHPEPRFVIPILLPMGYLFASGVAVIVSVLPLRLRNLKYVSWLLVIILLLATGKYLAGHRYVIFSLEKEVEGYRTAQYLEGLPGDGVMAQVGYPPEIAYLTDKRVIALPVSPERLDYFIQQYDIHYLLYGQHYWAPIDDRNAPSIWCYSTIKYIKDNPARYPLLKVIGEDYRSTAWPDSVFIHAAK